MMSEMAMGSSQWGHSPRGPATACSVPSAAGTGKLAAMRFLFSFTGGSGHFLPSTVFARNLAHRGHEIRYTCQEAMVDAVTEAGWPVEPSGGASLLDPETARRPLVPVAREAEERAMSRFFAGKAARERANRLVDVIGKWGPQLLVRDEVDFGAAIAAEALGVPHAAIVVIAAGRLTRPEVTEGPLADLRSEFDLDRCQANDALHRYLLLVPVPPSFRDPRAPLPATARFVRPGILDNLPTVPATASECTGRRPRVYFTLGTIFPQESGDLFERVLTGLTTLPVEVTVTTGHAIAPADLGHQPSTVRVERFVPLVEALTASDLVISHGGSGTVISSLALGQPQIVLPMGADQPDNADRCEHLGVGVHLDPVEAGPEDIASVVDTVLQAPEYRLNARRIADEAGALPHAEQAVSLLEGVARTGLPITTLDPEPTA